MGKKYDFLKERLEKNKVRDLLVINDRLVREKYFAEANDVLRQIDGLEARIKTFHSQDQRLFDQWYKLTFQADQRQVDDAQEEFRKLARFHNWVVAASRMYDIGMAEAYGMIKDEEKRYMLGDAETRSRIERDRNERDEFIEADAREKYNEEPSFEGDDENQETSGAHLDQVLSHLEDLMLPEGREPGLGLAERFQRLMALRDGEIRDWLSDQEVAFMLFDVSLSWAESSRDPAFFLRIWRLMSRTQRRTFRDVYYALTGQNIEDLVTRWSRGGETEDDEEEFQFNEEFIGPRGKRSYEHSISPPEEEKLKTLYRKLIRKLHPDTNGGTESWDWIQRVWNSVQKAYTGKDVPALERLLSLTLFRMNDLTQLTLDEINQAKKWLEKDLSALEQEARQLKRSMAWGFSLKKDHWPLHRKIKREFEQSIQTVRNQIEEIEKEHRILEMLSGMEDRPKAPQKKSKGRFPRGRRGRRRWKGQDENQESFSWD